MALPEMLKILLLGISILSKCQFSSARAQLGSDSRSSMEVTFDLYEIMEDLFELKYEDIMLANRVELLEGRLNDHEEKIEVLEGIADEGKLIAGEIAKLEGQTSDQTDQIEIFEGIASEGKLKAEKIGQLEEQMSEQTNKIEQLEGKMSERTDKIEQLEGQMSDQTNKVEQLEGQMSDQTNKVEQLEGHMTEQTKQIEMLEGIVDEGKLMADKFKQLEGRLNDQAELIEKLKGKMADQEEQIEDLEGVIESQKIALTEQAEAIEILQNKLESTESTTESTTTESTTTESTTTESTTESTTEARHAFQVMRSKEVTYKGYDFLALEVTVPADGLSRSPNWCYDYQFLCDDFNRRPTGCSSPWASSTLYSSCRDKYNSDMSIDSSVFGCHPSPQIAAVANIAFPNLSPSAQYKNAFGFYRCDNCKRTLQASDLALTFMRGFWESNMTTFYTVCH